jgi:hypothetical protein
MYCLIYIIGFPSGESRCSLHFFVDRSIDRGKFERAIKIWRKRSGVLWRSFERLLRLNFLRVPASKCVTEQLHAVSSFIFLSEGERREAAYSAEEDCFSFVHSSTS